MITLNWWYVQIVRKYKVGLKINVNIKTNLTFPDSVVATYGTRFAQNKQQERAHTSLRSARSCARTTHPAVDGTRATDTSRHRSSDTVQLCTLIPHLARSSTRCSVQMLICQDDVAAQMGVPQFLPLPNEAFSNFSFR